MAWRAFERKPVAVNSESQIYQLRLWRSRRSKPTIPTVSYCFVQAVAYCIALAPKMLTTPEGAQPFWYETLQVLMIPFGKRPHPATRHAILDRSNSEPRLCAFHRD